MAVAIRRIRIRMRNTIQIDTVHIPNSVHYRFSYLSFSWFCVCVCFYFLWLKVKFSTRALALYVGYDVFTFVAMPLHSEERSKFETANKMMMSCWWCIHTSAHKRISILWAVSRLLLLTMNCKTMVFATTRSYTTTASHRHRHRHSRAVVVRYYKLFTNLYLLKPE